MWKGHRNYMKLVNEKDWTLRHILRRLRHGEIHVQWFPLLREVTGADPITDDDRGYTPRMARAWLDWAAKNNL